DEALETAVQHVVRDGERDPSPPGAARAEALARRDGETGVREELRRRHALRQPDPREERPFRARAGRPGDAVAARLVARPALLDRGLRAGERGDARLLDGPEDARADVRRQEVEPRHDLGVADDE